MNRGLARAAAVLALLPGSAAACSPRAARDPAIPTFKHVTGLALGSRVSTPAQIDAYLRAVDAATPKVRTFLAGRSGEGRPIRYAAVGAPGNVRKGKLEELGALMRRVRTATVPAARVRSIARSRPAFVWIGGNVHGNEPSGGDADMQLLYELASGRTCAAQRARRRVIVFFLPLQNPDGRAAGLRLNARGFDLNRDWFARTQPETQAKVTALVRFPPTVFADQHEEGGDGFFFPPNADPVHHEISAAALGAIDGIVAPRVRSAFRARGVPFTNYETYDLFFMGYGDTVPTTLFGAAGMTFEKGSSAPLPEKIAHHLLAARATVHAAVVEHRRLLERWGLQWRKAAAQGAAGTLQPNRVVQPHNSVRFEVPDTKVHGYVFSGGDARALVARLRSVGVRVQQLAAAAPARVRGFGDPAAADTTVAAGTYYVPLAQGSKHWIEALLADDPYVPFPYFYDVSSWSNALLMGVHGGALTAPLDAATTPVPAGDDPGVGDPPFAGGSEAAAEQAFALLGDGVALRRTADGGFSTTDGTPLRLPRVALLDDPATGDSGSWARWLLGERYGLDVAVKSPAQIAAGGLAASDVLVVPGDGSSQLSEAALVALQAWVRGGGTYVGWRSLGLAVARAAALTSVEAAAAPAAFQVPGVLLRTAVDSADPVAFGEAAEGFAFNQGDPIFAAHGAHVVVRYPAGERFFVSGYATGTEALKDTPAATDETLGGGRVVLFAFDPAFRGYAEGTERLVANALLAAPPSGAAARSVPRPVDPSLLATAGPAHRDATIQVAAEDEAPLLAAAAAAGVPAERTLERDLTTVTLRVPNPSGLDSEQRPWTRRLPAALAAAGVVPLLAIL